MRSNQPVEPALQENKPPLGMMPPTWFMLDLGLIGLIRWWFPGPVVVPWPWTLCSIAFIAIGCWFAVVADQQFKRHGTTVKPFQQSSTLVTDGVVRFSRHPMYLGMVLVLLGAAIASGTSSPFVVPIGFAVLLQYAFVIPEESAMLKQFGEDYTHYILKGHFPT